MVVATETRSEDLDPRQGRRVGLTMAIVRRAGEPRVTDDRGTDPVAPSGARRALDQLGANPYGQQKAISQSEAKSQPVQVR